MAIHIQDDATAELVMQLATRRGLSGEEAVRIAVQAELDRNPETVPLRDLFAGLRAAFPLPPRIGAPADKAFFDDLAETP